MLNVACRLVLPALAAALVAVGLAAPVASAHDAPMPDDARHGLIIDERWVMLHWAPFDERVAERALSLRPGQLEAFLYDDHHTIAQLAEQRGIGFERLVGELSDWADHTPGADPELIRQRVRLMLVSGHLAQHVFGHVFHGIASTSTLQRAVHLSQKTFAERRAQGWSYRDLIKRIDGDPAAVQYGISQALGRNQRRGVRRHETSPQQSTRLLHRQRSQLHCWFTRPAQLVDPAAPYGREYLKHVPGHTAADVPHTREEQTAEELALAASLAARPASCWTLPQAFTSDPGAPLSRQQLRELAGVPDGFDGPVNDQLDHPDMEHDEHAGH